MTTKLRSVIDVLQAAGTARANERRIIRELLSVDPTVARILLREDEELVRERDGALVDDIAKIVGDHRVRWNITDWPFEHFWENPCEARHSRLLGYFIDPREEHGVFLLRKLFDVLGNCFPDHPFLVDHRCQVEFEAGESGLSIKRRCDGGRYAVIIENKINGAVHRRGPLQMDISRAQEDEFDPGEIFVLYLPLNDAGEPNANDLDFIRKRGARYAKITFEEHILSWLDDVLGKENEPQWPAAMHQGMRDNLLHYRNLVCYLIKKEKRTHMDREILKQLERADQEGALPSLSQVQQLRDSADALKRCLESALRGKLLLQIMTILQRQGRDPWFCIEGKPAGKADFGGPYDTRFGFTVNLCVRVDDNVNVCFGGSPDGFWFGYMGNGDAREKLIEAAVLAEAQKYLGSIDGNEHLWYAWTWNREVDYDQCQDPLTAARLAETLSKMRDSLEDRLKNENSAQSKPAKNPRTSKEGF